MSTITNNPSWPITTELPSELAFLANHISMYFNADPPFNNASLGALIFTPPPHTPRLLLIQVLKTSDPHAFSNLWEIPNGMPKPSDLTLLHALSRIILEQTGLHLSRVYSMPSSQTGPSDGGGSQWMKLQFSVQVSELEGDEDRFSHQQALAYAAGVPEDYNFETARSQVRDPNKIPIKLNSATHSKHAWATEEDLIEFANTGLYPTEAGNVYQPILDAFALYKQDCESVKNRKKSRDETQPPEALVNPPGQESDTTARQGSPKPPARQSPKPGKSNPGRHPGKSSKPDPKYFHRFRTT